MSTQSVRYKWSVHIFKEMVNIISVADNIVRHNSVARRPGRAATGTSLQTADIRHHLFM